jgi:glutathione S-transferase
VWAGAQADIERVTAIWRECLQRYGGPYLFGKQPTMADAMYAPVCSRFATYDVKLDAASAGYRDLMLKFPAMLEWTLAAKSSPRRSKSWTSSFSSARHPEDCAAERREGTCLCGLREVLASLR